MSSSEYDWYPARLLQSSPPEKPEPYALLVLNQPLKSLWAAKRLWANASYRVAADGGANQLYDARGTAGESFKTLDVVIGDLDSLRDDTRSYFASDEAGLASEIIHDPDQYSTDYGKAVNHIRSRHPELHIVALGGLGGRVDQGISQLHHLYLFHNEAPNQQHFLLSSESLTFLLPKGHNNIHVRVDENDEKEYPFAKYVGILPLAGPSVITTQGLEWDVKDWDTRFDGHVSTSNHVLPETKVVKVEANLPVVFTIAINEP